MPILVVTAHSIYLEVVTIVVPISCFKALELAVVSMGSVDLAPLAMVSAVWTLGLASLEQLEWEASILDFPDHAKRSEGLRVTSFVKELQS